MHCYRQNTADDGGFTLDIQEIERFPATENHAVNVDKLRKCAADQNIVVTELAEPMRWSEDFGYYCFVTPFDSNYIILSVNMQPNDEFFIFF